MTTALQTFCVKSTFALVEKCTQDQVVTIRQVLHLLPHFMRTKDLLLLCTDTLTPLYEVTPNLRMISNPMIYTACFIIVIMKSSLSFSLPISLSTYISNYLCLHKSLLPYNKRFSIGLCLGFCKENQVLFQGGVWSFITFLQLYTRIFDQRPVEHCKGENS